MTPSDNFTSYIGYTRQMISDVNRHFYGFLQAGAAEAAQENYFTEKTQTVDTEPLDLLSYLLGHFFGILFVDNFL